MECCSVPCKCTGQRGYRGAVGPTGTKVQYILFVCSDMTRLSIDHIKMLNLYNLLTVNWCQLCLMFLSYKGSPGSQGYRGHPGDEGGPVCSTNIQCLKNGCRGVVLQWIAESMYVLEWLFIRIFLPNIISPGRKRPSRCEWNTGFSRMPGPKRCKGVLIMMLV